MAPDLASACARRRRDLVTRSANQRRGVTPGRVSSRDPCGGAPQDSPRPMRSASCDSRRRTLSITLQRARSEEHTSELQSQSNLVCRLLLEKKKNNNQPLVEARHYHI